MTDDTDLVGVDLDDLPHPTHDPEAVGGGFGGDICPFCGDAIALRADGVRADTGKHGEVHALAPDDVDKPVMHEGCYRTWKGEATLDSFGNADARTDGGEDEYDGYLKFADDGIEPVLTRRRWVTVRYDLDRRIGAGHHLKLVDEGDVQFGEAVVEWVSRGLSPRDVVSQSWDGYPDYPSADAYETVLRQFYPAMPAGTEGLTAIGLDPDSIRVAGPYVNLLDDEDVRTDGGDDPAPAFEIGAAVVDGDTDPKERGTMRVLRYVTTEDRDDEGAFVRLVTAEEHSPPGMSETLAEFAPDHPDDDLVVSCVFEGWLDESVPEWEQWPAEDLADELRRYSDEWGVPVRTYDYHESRLMHRPTCDECGERKDYLGAKETRQVGEADPELLHPAGYYCVNPDCAGEEPGSTGSEGGVNVDENASRGSK